MRKRNFFKYALNTRAVALLVVAFIVCAFVVGVCRVSGYWFLTEPIVYAYATFCSAYFLKSLADWLRYRR